MNHKILLALLMIMNVSFNLDAAAHSKPARPEDTKPNKPQKHSRAHSTSHADTPPTTASGFTTPTDSITSDDGHTTAHAETLSVPRTFASVSAGTTPAGSPKPARSTALASSAAREEALVALSVPTRSDINDANTMLTRACIAGIVTDYESHAQTKFKPKPDSLCDQHEKAIAALGTKKLSTDAALSVLEEMLGRYFEPFKDPLTETLKKHTEDQLRLLITRGKYSERDIHDMIEQYTCFPTTCFPEGTELLQSDLPEPIQKDLQERGTIKPAALLTLMAWHRQLKTLINPDILKAQKDKLKKLDTEVVSVTLQNAIRHDRSKRALPEETTGLNYLTDQNGDKLKFSESSDLTAFVEAHRILFNQSEDPQSLHTRKAAAATDGTETKRQLDETETKAKTLNTRSLIQLAEDQENIRLARQRHQYALFCADLLNNQREVQAACDEYFATHTKQDSKSLGLKRTLATKASSWLPSLAWTTPSDTPSENDSPETFFRKTVNINFAKSTDGRIKHTFLIGGEILPVRCLTTAATASDDSCTTPAATS